MDKRYSGNQEDIAGFINTFEVTRQKMTTNLKFGTLSGERRPASFNLGPKSQAIPGEDYPTDSVTFHRNGSKLSSTNNEDGSEIKERVKKIIDNSKNLTHSMQADGEALNPFGGRVVGKLDSSSKINISSTPELQSKDRFAEARPRCWREKENVPKDRMETVDRIMTMQRSSKPEHEIRVLENQSGQERWNKDASDRMDKKYSGNQADIAGFMDTSEVTRQKMTTNLKFGTSSGERRPALFNLETKSQAVPGEDYPAESVAFHRNRSNLSLTSNEDESERKERVKKIIDNFNNLTHLKQAGGEALNPFGGRVVGRLDSSSKINNSSTPELQSKDRFAEAKPRCWKEKENGSKDIMETTDGIMTMRRSSKPEHEIRVLENQSGQNRWNKGTQHKEKTLYRKDVSDRMDKKYSGNQADIAGFMDTSEVTRQKMTTNLNFGTSSGERRPALFNLEGKSQAVPGEDYPAESVAFHRTRSNLSLTSNEDKSERKERVKKIIDNFKNLTHSMQADGEAFNPFGGRVVGRLDSSSKSNNSSTPELQSKDRFAEARPRYSREKENVSKDIMETTDGIMNMRRSSKPEHEIRVLENQSGQNRWNKGTQHKEETLYRKDVSDRMDKKYSGNQADIAGFMDTSEVTRQKMTTNLNFGTSSGERRPALFNLEGKFQAVPGEDYPAESVAFHKTRSNLSLTSNEDESERKERVKKIIDNFNNLTHSVQADGEALNPFEGRVVGRLDSSSKSNNSSTPELQSKDRFAESRPRYSREKENVSKDIMETIDGIMTMRRSSKPEHEIRVLENQSGQERWNKGTQHKEETLYGKDVSDRMDKKYSGNQADIAGFMDTFEVTRQKMTTNLNFGTSSGERRPALFNLEANSQAVPGEDYPTESVAFHRTRSNLSLTSNEDRSETKDSVKKIIDNSKNLTHSIQADGEALNFFGGNAVGRLESSNKYNNSSTPKLQSEDIFAQARPMYWREKENGSSGSMETMDCIIPLQRPRSASKLLIYFPEEKVRKSIVLSPPETESRFKQHFEIIMKQATEYLALHEAKIKEKYGEVMKLKERVKGGNLSLREFESTKSEIKPTKDKCKELERQKKEFGSYIRCVHDKLEEIKNSVKFETKMNEIRIAFGIECRRLSNALPIYARRSDILNAVKNSQVSVILGETGSGKSTQMTQYLYQAGLAEHGLIACTQPRKIAAVTLATHVSSEMASSVGQIVGYHVGMKVKRTNITKIMYMTDHILLNECLKDNELKNFSCIIIDEAHERSIFTDLLLGMIKSALKKRPDLKVVITSATINPDVFVSYFGGTEKCPVVHVSGRAYPVEVTWLKSVNDQNPFEDYVTQAVNITVDLHRQHPPADGDILVFLTTPLETEKCCEEFVQKCLGDNSFQCLPLHGKLQPEEQQEVFQPNTPNKRKVVFATNSAETSITIPGVRFVVDSGLAKEMRFDPKRNISSLRVYPVSQSSAEQRKGRAGRTSPGKCYRLYNEETYETMEKSTKPEILRVHLGQALLKLLELGVDPLSFDFVESPTQEALENAMESLCDIGAVEDSKITKLGHWISKLPIEPRQGLLLKKGILAGIPMEALIVASFSGGSGTFYRSGANEEKKRADIQKVKFCHMGGDILTFLNVYRKWDKVPEKQKGHWCFENYINAKSMKGVRETMNELRTVLKRDLGEDVLFEFRSVEKADHILKKLLVEILKQNVCCFLGHEKAGYFNLVNHQHVQIHPSSVLKPLDLQPELIVYEQVLQTYTDFVTNVTPIDEAEMMVLPLKVRDIYKKKMDNIRVSLKQTYWAGKKAMKQFVGPLHQNRKETEERLSAACGNRTVVLDANKITGKIQLYCCKVDEQCTLRMLKDVLDGLTKPMLKKCLEVPVVKSDKGVRVVLGAGGEVISVLMPHQYRTILIKQKLLTNKEMEVSDIRAVFSAYGEITDIKPFRKKNRKDPTPWGTVTFCSDTDAKNALISLTFSGHRFFEAIPVVYGTNSEMSKDFRLKLTWWRRPGKGIAYVTMVWPEDFVKAMATRSITIDGHIISIEQTRNKGTRDTTNQLYLRGLPYDIAEDDIKAAFARFLGLSEADTNDRIKHIVVPREASETSQQMCAALYKKVEQEVSQYASKEFFDIIFAPDPLKNQKCIRYTVFVNFSNPDEGQAALNGMQMNPPSFGVYPVHVTAELETSVAISKNIYVALKSDIEPFIESIRSQFPNVYVKTNTSKAGNIFINIKTNNTSLLAHVKISLHDLVQGDVLECGRNKEVARLFTRDGRSQMERIQKETGTVIFVDNRTMSVSVQGTQASRRKALSGISMYLGTLAGLLEKHMQLKGDGKPRGLMKELIAKYGTDLEQMKEESGVKSLKFDFRNHKITVLGDEGSVGKMETMIKGICDGLQKSPYDAVSEMPDCPICLCSVEESNMYRPEYCGHPYCGECIKNQLKSAIQDKNFPILCAVANCKQPLVLDDFTALFYEGCSTQQEVVKSAISCFVSKNNLQFQYCITPNCNMVYRVTAEGAPFTCSECQQRICTSCHVQYHSGMTCTMYQAEKRGENTVDSWLAEDNRNRKRCPKCSTPIEKAGGCNHMQCGNCHIHICWVCLQTFDTEPACYGHMSSAHNSFV